MSCSRTQGSDSGEDQTGNPSLKSLDPDHIQTVLKGYQQTTLAGRLAHEI